MFIVFEGIDGSGKDTVINRVINEITNNPNSYLYIDKYVEVVRTREPYLYNKYGLKIENLINKLKKDGVSLKDYKQEESRFKYGVNLYAKNRDAHCKLIKKDLKKKRIVISSRYDLSLYAYWLRSNSTGYDLDYIYEKSKYNKKTLVPDITIFLDVEVENSIKRINARNRTKDIFENRMLLLDVKNNYKRAIDYLQQKDKRLICTVDGNKSVDEVLKSLEKIFKEYFIHR